MIECILKQFLRRTENEALKAWSLCAVSADELLFACDAAGLRALSLHIGQLAAREPTDLRDVYRVTFDAHTDTLLLVRSPNADNMQLVSASQRERVARSAAPRHEYF